MIGKKTIASSGVTFIAAAGFIIVACSDKPEDSGGNDNGGGTAGSAGAGIGGSTSGGTAGTGPTGGTAGSSTGGSVTGGSGGQGGSAGGGAGGGTAGPFTCTMPVASNCNSITNFPVSTAQTFGTADMGDVGNFSGGVSIFPSGMATTIMRDTNTAALHVTGMVSGYGVGFNIWFTHCSTLAAHTGIQFTISGTTTDMAPMMANKIQFQLQTNSDYPWEPFMTMPTGKGNCTAPAGMDPWGHCIAPSIDVTLSPTASPAPQTVTWAMMMGGGPTAWDATMSPQELVGIQWQFPWSEGRMPYAFDVTLDDVSFTGGTAAACPAYMTGGGGMGGAGGGGAGMAGSGGAPGGGAGMAGGGAGGAGGAGAGMAGTGGT
jgi:hypothetical protein